MQSRFHECPMKNLFSLIAVAVLAGCTTSSSKVGQVQEVGPGTYKLAFSTTSETVFTGHKSTDAAVDQAGQYCHAKGQKLEIVPSKESGVVVFRCGEMIEQPVTPNAAPTELKAQKQQDQTNGAGQN
jgi:uncharacterized lipoprotein YajG